MALRHNRTQRNGREEDGEAATWQSCLTSSSCGLPSVRCDLPPRDPCSALTIQATHSQYSPSSGEDGRKRRRGKVPRAEREV
eukprot:1751793-Rhodomonas_salina.1